MYFGLSTANAAWLSVPYAARARAEDKLLHNLVIMKSAGCYHGNLEVKLAQFTSREFIKFCQKMEMEDCVHNCFI